MKVLTFVLHVVVIAYVHVYVCVSATGFCGVVTRLFAVVFSLWLLLAMALANIRSATAATYICDIHGHIHAYTHIYTYLARARRTLPHPLCRHFAITIARDFTHAQR